MYDNNPLIGGILAAAVGAALGSTIPVSRTEEEALGGIGSKARDIANEGKEQVTSQLRDKKDEIVDKAEEAMKPVGSSQSENVEAPFILSEKVT